MESGRKRLLRILTEHHVNMISLSQAIINMVCPLKLMFFPRSVNKHSSSLSHKNYHAWQRMKDVKKPFIKRFFKNSEQVIKNQRMFSTYRNLSPKC